MNREAIYSALFALIQTSVQASSTVEFKTISRKLKLWGEVPDEARPALFQFEPDEQYHAESRAVPAVITLNPEIFIYITADQNTLGEQVLSPLLDAIDYALRPDNMLMGINTLGGLVDRCWIEGKVFRDPGDLDGDGMAKVSIKILLPNET